MIKKIADIQIFRALAIIFVLLQHLSITNTVAIKFPIQANLPFYVGVELFFVISGYVVSKSLFSKDIKPFDFIVKRVFRIYPALLFFILFGTIINFIFQNLQIPEPSVKLFLLSWQEFIYISFNILLGIYINNDVPSSAYLFGAMWSLSVEFQFYAFVTVFSSILLHFLKRTKGEIELNFFKVFTFLYVTINLIRFIKFFIQIDIAFFNYLIKWNFDFMFIGFALAIAEKKGWADKLTHISREVSLFISPLLITLPLGLIAISESPFSAQKIILQGWVLPITGICFTILVYLASTVGCFPGQQSGLYKFMYWLGDRSYSIYLLHFPVMAAVWILIYKFLPFLFNSPEWYGIIQALLTVLFLIPLVEFVYCTIEAPCIEFSKKILKS